MADKTFSALTAAGVLTGTEVVPIVQTGNSRRTTAQAIANLAPTQDHGTLGGLGDDDHTQYLTNGRGDARFAPISHVGAGGAEHVNASGASAGFMSSADKAKLDALAFGGASVGLSADFATSSAAYATLSWGTEHYDVGGWWTIGVPTKLIVPAGISYVELGLSIGYNISSGVEIQFDYGIEQNGLSIAAATERMIGYSASGPSFRQLRTMAISCAEGDEFTVRVRGVLIAGSYGLTVRAGASKWAYAGTHFWVRKLA
jgi:hypothetical protein